MDAKEVTISDLTVIIPTYQGVDKLPHALASLEKQTVDGFEVVVVVDGSTDGTDAFLSGYSSRRFTLKAILQENAGRASVRNRGAEEAQGRLLLFMDDDMVLEEDVIEGHWTHHEQYPGTVLVGGQFMAKQLNDSCSRYRAEMEKGWYGHLPVYPEQMTEDHLFVTAAHLSLPALLFSQIGGFDKHLTDCEDIELGYRLLKQSVNIYLAKHLIGWHVDVVGWRMYLKRKKEYGSARALVDTLHPEFARTAHRIPSLKRLLIPIFRLNLWLALMEQNLLGILPKTLRYRLYSLILWTHQKKSYSHEV